MTEDQTLLLSLTEWVTSNPTLSGLIIFLIAFAESMVIIGVIVPGALLMIGIGVLVANGTLELGPTLLWAIGGAVAGDGLSFWLGYHFRERLLQYWPFNRAGKLIDYGTRFFEKHGGKSILLGRFVGPVRAIIPTIAGLMAMKPARFTSVNILSAVLWAPVYMLPGLVLGTALELAAEVTVRLVIILLLLIVIIIVARWLSRILYTFFSSHARQFQQRLLAWGQRHKLLGNITDALVDPHHPESPVLFGLAAILILSGVIFLNLATGMSPATSGLGFDNSTYNILQSLRTPTMDSVMTAITMFGDTAVYSVVVVIGLAWLFAKGYRLAAWHWIAAIAFGAILVRILKVTLDIPRPAFEGMTAGQFSFPSAHTTMSMVIYGFAAVLLSRELGPRCRYWLYFGTGLLVLLVAFSRLYLGVHWFSDVIAGLTLGMTWVTLTGIAYRRHASKRIPAKPFARLILVTLGITISVHMALNLETHKRGYQLRYSIKQIDTNRWLDQDWASLPAWRNKTPELYRQPMNIQWAGNLEHIRNHLKQKGWRDATVINWMNTVQWLHPKARISNMPVLPHTFKGRHEKLTMILDQDDQQHTVLRLWPSDRQLGKNTPLWIGNVSGQSLQRSLKLFSYPRTRYDFDSPMTRLLPHLHDTVAVIRWRKLDKDKPGKTTWNGKTLLIHVKPVKKTP